MSTIRNFMVIAAFAATSFVIPTGASAEDSDTAVLQSIHEVQRRDHDLRREIATGTVRVVRPASDNMVQPLTTRR